MILKEIIVDGFRNMEYPAQIFRGFLIGNKSRAQTQTIRINRYISSENRIVKCDFQLLTNGLHFGWFIGAISNKNNTKFTGFFIIILIKTIGSHISIQNKDLRRRIELPYPERIFNGRLATDA